MAAELAGGKEGLVGYLLQQARQGNPSPFMTGLSKLIPHQVEANVDASVIVEVVHGRDARWSRVGASRSDCLPCPRRA